MNKIQVDDWICWMFLAESIPVGVVYIRTTKNSAGQTYYHLVEAYREGSKVRQRTLLSLGRAEECKLEALATALSKHLDLVSAVELAKSESRGQDDTIFVP